MSKKVSVVADRKQWGAISENEGADRMWMFDILTISPEDAILKISKILRNPADFIVNTIKDTQEGIFNESLPITVIFTYGSYNRRNNVAEDSRYLFHGEYGTNIINVICPKIISSKKYKEDIDFFEAMTSSVVHTKDGKIQRDKFNNPIWKNSVDIVVFEEMNVIYSHFDLSIKTDHYVKDDSMLDFIDETGKPHYLHCFSKFIINPRHIVHAINMAIMKEQVNVFKRDTSDRLKKWNDFKVTFKMPSASRGRFNAFQLVYIVPVKGSNVIERTNQTGESLPDPCLKALFSYQDAGEDFEAVLENGIVVDWKPKITDPTPPSGN